MNIIVTMAGRGARFSDVGYPMPKPLIEVENKHVIEWTTRSLPFIEHYNKNKETEWFFGEDQSRYLVILNNAGELKKFAKKKKVKIEEVALVEDNNFFEIENKFKIPIKKLIKYNNSWYKKFINK